MIKVARYLKVLLVFFILMDLTNTIAAAGTIKPLNLWDTTKSTFLKKDTKHIYEIKMEEPGRISVKLSTNSFWEAWVKYAFKIRIEDSKGKKISEIKMPENPMGDTMITGELDEGKYYYIIERFSEIDENMPYLLNVHVDNSQDLHKCIKFSERYTLSEKSSIPLNVNGHTEVALAPTKEVRSQGTYNSETDNFGTLFKIESEQSQNLEMSLAGLEFNNATFFITDENFKCIDYIRAYDSGEDVQTRYVNLEKDKNYYVGIVNDMNAPKTYELKLKATPQNNIEIEPNNLFREGQILKDGQVYTGRKANIDNNGARAKRYPDVDWYVVEIEKDGLAVFNISFRPTKDYYPEDMRVALFNKDRYQLAYNLVDQREGKSVMPVGLKKGTYYLKIDSGFLYDENEPYKVGFNIKKDSQFLDFESNERFEDAYPIKMNSKIKGSLQTFYDEDYYRVNIPKDGTIEYTFSTYEDYSIGENCEYAVEFYNSKKQLVHYGQAELTYEGRSLWNTLNGKLKNLSLSGLPFKKGDYYIRIYPICPRTSEKYVQYQYFKSFQTKKDPLQYKAYHFIMNYAK